MFSGIGSLARGWFAAVRSGWPLVLAIAFLAAGVAYTIAAPLGYPLVPEFTFSNRSDAVEASGTLQTADSNVPNATRIFCWFPVNTCDLVVAELVPEGSRSRFKIVEKSLDIIQLSDATLTATASSTDPCQVETLRIDRKAQSATLSVNPASDPACAGGTTFTARLGG
jgi:hypothetical protein